MINDTSEPDSFKCSFAAFAARRVRVTIRAVWLNPSKLLPRFHNKALSALFMSFVSKCFSVVTLGVFRLRKQFEILRRVIKGVMVYVMDYFVFFKFSTKQTLHNISMFIGSSSVDTDLFVTVRSNASIARLVSFVATIKIIVSHKSRIVHSAVSSCKFVFIAINDFAFHRGILAQVRGVYQ